MKKIYIALLILVSLILFFFRIGIVQNKRVSFGLSTFLTTQGGTGTTSPSGILYGDNGATGSLKTATIGSGLSFSGGTLSSTGGTNYLTNSGINTYLNTGTFLQAPAFVATSSSATTTIQNLNNIFYVPEDFATNGCAGDSSKTKLDTCVEALLSLAVSKGLTTATIWITADVPQSAWTGTMDIAQNGLQTSLFCRSGVRLKYGGSGNAILWNNGDPTGHLKQEIAGCIFMGQNSLIAAGNSNSTTTVGIYYGGGNGAVGINTHDNTFNGFGTQVEIGQNAYMLEFNNNGFSGGNGGRASQGSLVHINTASNSGERNVFNGNNFTDPANGDADECFYIEQTGTASNFITNNSIDNCQIVVLASNGQVVISENHFENPGAPSGFAEYIPILGASSDGSVTMNINGNEFANSASNRTWTTIIRHGGQLYASGNRIDNYNGFTVTNFVLHDLNNGQSSDHVCQTQVQGGNLTNIIGGSGGTTWSLTNGVPCLINRSNSYTIGLRALGSNTNQFFSGGSTVGTFDHDGNWTLGDSAVDSLTTIYKRLYVPNSIGIGTSSPFTMLGVAGTITTNNINATSTATSTIANLGGVLYAPAFQDAGEDIGKAINDAYAFCPIKGCIIEVPRGQFSFSTPILLNTNGKRALVRGTPAGGTELTYTGTATSTTINWGIQASGIDHTSGCGLSNITLTANARSTSTSPIIGIEVGGTNGSDCTLLENVNIQGFGYGLWSSANTYHFNYQNGVIRNNGQNVHIAGASNSGELLSFNDAFIVDGYATYGEETDNCFFVDHSGTASLLMNGTSFDDCQLVINQANNVTINGGHFENPGQATWGKYTYIVVDNNTATNLSINGTTFFNVATVNTPDTYISNGGTLTLNGVITRQFGGTSVPVFVTNTGSGRVTWQGLNNVSGTGVTNVVGSLKTLSGSTGSFALSTSTTGCATFGSLGELFSTGTACGSGSSFGFPFTPTTWNSVYNVQSTTTALNLMGMYLASTSNPIANLGGNNTAGDWPAMIWNQNSTVGLSTGIAFGVSATLGGSPGGGIGFIRQGSSSAGDMFFATADIGYAMTEKVRIKGGGQIGIGTTTPQYLLSIASSTVPQLSLSAGAGLAQWTFRNAGGNLYLSTTTVAGTATTSTSALSILNTGEVIIRGILQFFSSAGTKIMEITESGVATLLGTWDFSGATVKQHTYKSFTYATSTAWTATTTIPLGPAYTVEAFNGVKCFTDTGTLNVSFYDGTNRMNMFNASTTIGTVVLSTNNTFTASETRYVDVGTPASSPTKISCTVDVTVNN